MPNASFIISTSFVCGYFYKRSAIFSHAICENINFPLFLLTHSFIATVSPNVNPMTSNSFGNNCPPTSRNTPTISQSTHDLRQAEWQTTEWVSANVLADIERCGSSRRQFINKPQTQMERHQPSFPLFSVTHFDIHRVLLFTPAIHFMATNHS